MSWAEVKLNNLVQLGATRAHEATDADQPMHVSRENLVLNCFRGSRTKTLSRARARVCVCAAAEILSKLLFGSQLLATSAFGSTRVDKPKHASILLADMHVSVCVMVLEDSFELSIFRFRCLSAWRRLL